jgi:hypothetical protein
MRLRDTVFGALGMFGDPTDVLAYNHRSRGRRGRRRGSAHRRAADVNAEDRSARAAQRPEVRDLHDVRRLPASHEQAPPGRHRLGVDTRQDLALRPLAGHDEALPPASWTACRLGSYIAGAAAATGRASTTWKPRSADTTRTFKGVRRRLRRETGRPGGEDGADRRRPKAH